MVKIAKRPSAGIITFHKSLSYGGCLQAYASQLILENAGYDVFFIDYENAYEARKKSNAIFRYGTTKEKLASIVKSTIYKQNEYQKRAFATFHQMLPLSAQSYSDFSSMNEISADVLAVASDQVWNPEITGEIDPAFFLNFGYANKRISIASSMGSHLLTSDELEECLRYVKRFDAVSVREKFARQQLESGGRNDVHIALDPTLQIAAEKWRDVAVRPDGIPGQGQYVLVFMVSSSPSRYESLLVALLEQRKIPVIMVRLNSKKPGRIDTVFPATPFELVKLIDDAALVLTDSFHGIAFSINLETPFLALSNRSNNIRLLELLRSAGLDNRMVEESVPLCINPWEADFSMARNMLFSRRERDTLWLKDALGKVGGCA